MNKKILLIFLSFFIIQQGFTQCLPQWKYTRSLTISNSNGSTLTNFQVKIIINTQTLISQGKLMNNANDLRFTTSSCQNIHFWIDSGFNTTNTIIWLKMPSLPNGNTNIVMHYGNICASNTMNGDSTFMLFDDFSGGSLSSKWSTHTTSGTANFTVGGGSILISATNDASIRSVANFASPIVLETKVLNYSGNFPHMSIVNNGTFNGYAMYRNNGANLLEVGRTSAAGNSLSANSVSNAAIAATFGVWQMNWSATGAQFASFPNSSSFSTTNGFHSLGANNQVVIGSLNTGTGSIRADWVRVRKYAADEATFSVGSENPKGLEVTYSPQYGCPGDSISIFTTKRNLYFNNGNQFIVELSDNTGSFSSPTVLATYTDTIPRDVKGLIPTGITPGSGYLIRVRTTNTAYTCFTADAGLTIGRKPTAAFTFSSNNQCYKWNNYTVNSTSSVAAPNSIAEHIWIWGDGRTDTTFGAGATSAQHSFRPFYNYYRTLLKVVTNLGCTDTISRVVDILETPDISTQFNDTVQCFKGHFLTVKSKTIPLTGTIVSKQWKISDGVTADKFNIDSFSLTFANPGIYGITQINEHSNGCRDTNILYCAINEQPLTRIRVLNDTSQCFKVNYFEMENNSSIGNGLPLVNNWSVTSSIFRDDFDSIAFKINTVGTYTVRLITVADDGEVACQDTAYQVIHVRPEPTASLFRFETELCENGNLFRVKSTTSVSSGTLTNNWTMGDGNFYFDEDSIGHSYASDGLFNIKLVSRTQFGCADSVNSTLRVFPSPIAGINILNNSQCLNQNNFKVLNTSTISSGTISKNWLINDVSTYNDVDSILHNFSSKGRYEIKLIVNSNNNCKDTFSDSVTVLLNPVANIVNNTTEMCFRGNDFRFEDQSLFTDGALTGNRWDLGDLTIINDNNNFHHTYLAEGVYEAILITYADNGCTDTGTVSISVNPHAQSDFLINTIDSCINSNRFVFTANSFISDGTFTNFWQFGDGTTSNANNPTKRYTTDSLFTVTNITNSDKNCRDTIRKFVRVHPKPVSNYLFNNDRQCLLDNQFVITPSTTIKYGTYQYSWTLGDGNSVGNVNPVIHSYTNPGLFNVRLITTSNNLCRDTIIKQARVWNMPVASFNANYLQHCINGNNFTFAQNSTLAGGGAMTHDWAFGDGTDSLNSPTSRRIYSNYGSYQVRLISISTNGLCRDTFYRNVTVHPSPVPNFTILDNEQCFLNHLFEFNSSISTIPTGTIDFYNWKFGDGTTSSMQSPTKSYNSVDSFRVTLSLTSDFGCVDSIKRSVYINPMPVANFSVSPKIMCLKNNRFNFVNSSTINNGFINDYKWHFTPNDSSSLQTPLPFSFLVSGDYQIYLRATTDKGCWDTVSRFVTVSPNPDLDFDVDPVCLGDSSEFINNSSIVSGSIVSYRWQFGDGKSSILESPKYKYRNVGIYDVRLIAVTDRGCRDTLDINAAAQVNPNPKAGFYFTKVRSWENEVDIQFTDTSSGGPIKWEWDFGSIMGNSSVQNPLLYYTDTANQRTKLVVTNVFGCTDTLIKYSFIAPDVIYYMPSAFSPNDDNINDGIKPVGLAYALKYKLIIFNRWGEILFSTDNPKKGWDGKYKGDVVEQGLYFYRLEFVGSDDLRHELVGNIMILY